MTFCSKRLKLASGLAAVVFSSGCATPGAQRFGMSFLPQVPRPVQSHPVLQVAFEPPPPVPANKWITESHTYFKPAAEFPPRPSQVDLRIRRANERFDRGRESFDQGNAVAARVEFDAAVDILLGTPESLPDRHKVEPRLEQMVAAIYKFDVNRLGAGDLSSDPAWDKAPLDDILDLTFPLDPRMKPRVVEQLRATTSQLPLEMNDAVLSYINYFSGERGRATLLAGLRRAGRYKPLISRILADEGVPQELIYLAQAESGFLPRARSHKAAVGMWQFVQARGREYGLTQTRWTDDRLDPEKATRSAARHLRDLYDKFGDWYLAIAAYNCGDGCVERAVERTGFADFWELRSRNAVPRETTNYVPIIIAMTLMHKNAQDYGLENIATDPPLQWETVEIESATHLALIADAADRPVSEIRELNPALLSNVAPPGYPVHVPAGTKTPLLAALSTIPPERRASWRIHRVSGGETLASIARQYRMAVSAIASANSVEDARPGDVLIIPTASELERKSAAKTKARRSVSSSKAKSSSTRSKAATAAKKPAPTASRTVANKPAPAAARTATKPKPARRGVQSASLR